MAVTSVMSTEGKAYKPASMFHGKKTRYCYEKVIYKLYMNSSRRLDMLHLSVETNSHGI